MKDSRSSESSSLASAVSTQLQQLEDLLGAHEPPAADLIRGQSLRPSTSQLLSLPSMSTRDCGSQTQSSQTDSNDFTYHMLDLALQYADELKDILDEDSIESDPRPES